MKTVMEKGNEPTKWIATMTNHCAGHERQMTTDAVLLLNHHHHPHPQYVKTPLRPIETVVVGLHQNRTFDILSQETNNPNLNHNPMELKLHNFQHNSQHNSQHYPQQELLRLLEAWTVSNTKTKSTLAPTKNLKKKRPRETDRTFFAVFV